MFGIVEGAIAAVSAHESMRKARQQYESLPKRAPGPTLSSLEDPVIADAWEQFMIVYKLKGYCNE